VIGHTSCASCAAAGTCHHLQPATQQQHKRQQGISQAVKDAVSVCTASGATQNMLQPPTTSREGLSYGRAGVCYQGYEFPTVCCCRLQLSACVHRELLTNRVPPCSHGMFTTTPGSFRSTQQPQLRPLPSAPAGPQPIMVRATSCHASSLPCPCRKGRCWRFAHALCRLPAWRLGSSAAAALLAVTHAHGKLQHHVPPAAHRQQYTQ
jgi:hypothetical protein